MTIRFILAVGIVLCGVPVAGQLCDIGWDQSIGVPGMAGSDGEGANGRALAVFDDGTGLSLYSGGIYFDMGGSTVNGIARWDGSDWHSLDGGVEEFSRVYALIVFDDGNGSSLYAGGSFTLVGGQAANSIAKWDGTSWSALGDGLTEGGSTGPIVFALELFDDGTGLALYAAGRFDRAGDVDVNNIAKWDGAEWSDVGGGLDGMTGLDRVNALKAHDDGHGPALYVGGMLAGAGGIDSPGIVRWNGTEWSGVVGGANNHVRALGVYDDGTGPALYAGGNFSEIGSTSAQRIARWNGSRWTAMGEGLGGPNPWVTSLTVFDDGSGPSLYAGGKFTESGDRVVNRIARWSGSEWVALAGGANDNIYGLGVFDDGTGSALYVTGRFTTIDGLEANHVAQWGRDRILFDNGPLITDPGAGFGGADVSALQTSIGGDVLGYGHEWALDNRVADDFEVPENGWDIQSITFFAYQSLAGIPSTISAVNLQIWDGPPDDPGSTVIFGDRTTNRLVNSVWSGIYRTEDTDLTNTDHAIMANTVEVGITLDAGAYWLDWQSDGSPLFSGPWAPPVTVPLTPASGNALQSLELGVWIPLEDVEAGWIDDLPFVIEGVVTADCNTNGVLDDNEDLSVIYVDSDAPPEGDGTTWDSAFVDLQNAIDVANCACAPEIWVAAGTYKPTGSRDRTATFQLPNGVAIYGGFDGTETTLAERAGLFESTILSGDIGVPEVDSDNSYHVVTGSGTDVTTVLNGFTITAGYASGNNLTDSRGAGMYIDGGSPTVEHCRFDSNHATGFAGGQDGGGMAAINGSSPQVIDCVFTDNEAGEDGGAIWNQPGCDVSLVDCTFRNNLAGFGGGIFNSGNSPTLTNCLFENNNASLVVGMGGAIFNQNDTTATLVGCTFIGNWASDYGGAIANEGSSAVLTDCTFIGNSAGLEGGAAYAVSESSLTLINCRIVGNAAGMRGGGLDVSTLSALEATNCLFVGNESVASHGGALHVQDGSSARAINCALADNRAGELGGGIRVDDGLGVTITNCILWGNSDSAGMDESAQIEVGEGGDNPAVSYCDIQGLDTFAGNNNMGLDPLFVGGDTGNWTDQATYDPESGQTTFFDADANFAVNELVDTFLNPQTSQVLQSVIVSNTATEIVTAGDLAAQGMSGATYQINDYHLGEASPCIHRGSNVAVPADVTDLDEDDNTDEPIPYDLDGSDRLVFIVDIGPYEVSGAPPLPTLYVDVESTGESTGLDWANAYLDLTSALDSTEAADGAVTEIWVAQGTYLPDGGAINGRGEIVSSGSGDRSASIQLLDGVTVYGGFPSGGGDGTFEVRDPDSFESVLSGDLDNDDGPDFQNYGDNSFHVVTGSGTGSTAVLDGFTITAGNANGNSLTDSRGAGMYNDGGNPSVLDCLFDANQATGFAGGGDGAGMANINGASPLITGCAFTNNKADEDGGGIWNQPGCDVTVVECSFRSNVAGTGGGMFNNGNNPTVTNCIFESNVAVVSGLGGGMANQNLDSGTVTDSQFVHNAATDNGGGVSNENSSLVFSRCTFTNNAATEVGGGVSNENCSPIFVRCAFVNNVVDPISGAGGAMDNVDASSPTIVNCRFLGNSANSAAAIHNASDSHPTFANCLFSGNAGAGDGGAIGNNAGDMFLANCTFTDNVVGGSGGAIHNAGGGNPVIVNCVFWDNSDSGGTDESAQIHNDDGSPSVNHSLIQGLTGELGGINNIGDDPSFVGGPTGMWTDNATYDADTGQTTLFDADAGFAEGELVDRILNPQSFQVLQSLIVSNTATEIVVWGDFSIQGASGSMYKVNDYRLAKESPCLDSASNDAVPADSADLDADDDTGEATPLDLDDHQRFIDDVGAPDCPRSPGLCGDPPIVDRGAYERQLGAAVCEGDANDDGIVDPLDSGYVLARFGCPVGTGDLSCDAADQNGDGEVNPLDSGFVIARFGPCR